MNIDVWVIGTPNQFLYEVLKLEKNLRFLLYVQFILPVITLASDRADLNGSVAFSVLVFLTKKRFYEKALRFSEVLKTFKISSDCHKKTC